jgi:hypothetical protein
MLRGRGTPPEALVDKHGNLHVPSDYPALYEFLGTLAIAADKGAGSSELHTWGSSAGHGRAHIAGPELRDDREPQQHVPRRLRDEITWNSTRIIGTIHNNSGHAAHYPRLVIHGVNSKGYVFSRI